MVWPTLGSRTAKEQNRCIAETLLYFLVILQVFQPLLLEYFSYDELCQLRLRVIELHQKRQEQEKFTWTECEKEGSFSCNILCKYIIICLM